MSMSKGKLIGVTFFIATVAVLIGFSIQQHQQATRYQRLLTQHYTYAFSELTAAADELDTALAKAVYTTPGPLQTSLYQQIYAKTLAAQSALGQLPYSNVLLEQTTAFFAKTGDYVLALCRGAADEGDETLAQLSQASSALATWLNELQVELDYGGGDFSSLEATLATLSAQAESVAAPAGDVTVQAVEAEFPEVPSLVYDGPFSEHLTGQTPRMLENQPDISAQEAQRVAAGFLDLEETALTLLSQSEGDLPTYSFSFPEEGGTGYLEITRQGGQVLCYFSDQRAKTPVISAEMAQIYAENYLVSWGFPQMKASYTVQQDGKLTLHYAPVMDGVLCYPDLVKVTVSLADGKVLGYEGAGYLTHHTQRTFPAPAVTRAEAANALPASVSILSSQLALIPTAGGTEEVLTYEFKTENSQGQHILFYINAETGIQQNILLLLEDESGTLAL